MRKSVIAAFLAATCLIWTPGTALADQTSASPSPTGSTGPELTEEQKLAPYVQPSVVYISVEWQAWLYDKVLDEYLNDGQPITVPFRCTGYVVNPNGWIVTAGHCVEYDDSTRDALVDKAIEWSASDPVFAEFANDPDFLEHHFSNSVRYEGQAERDRSPDRTTTASWGATVSGLETEDGKLARVVAFQRFDEGDTALLKVDESDLNALPLIGADDTVETLTGIAAVGYAGSVDAVTDDDYVPSIKTGTVSAEKTIGGGLVSVYEIDAAVSPGMSGGPTVTYDGEVVGTNSFGVTGEPQAFNFVGQSDRVHELLDAQGVENVLSETTQNYRAGIDAYFAGDKAEAIRLLTLVQEEQPANGPASEYLSLARDLPDPPPPPASDEGGGSSTLLIAAVAGAVVLIAAIVAGVVWLRRRRGDHRPASGPPAPADEPSPYDGAPPTAGPTDGEPVPVGGPVESPPQTRPVPAEVPVARAATSDQDRALAGSLGFSRPGSPASHENGRPAADPVTAHTDVTTSLRFCGECGTQAEGGNFCRACGKALT